MPMLAVICHIRSMKIGRMSDARSDSISESSTPGSSPSMTTANSSSSKRPKTRRAQAGPEVLGDAREQRVTARTS